MSDTVSMPHGPKFTMDVQGEHGNPIRVVVMPLARNRRGERCGEVSFYDLRTRPYREDNPVQMDDGTPRDPDDGQFITAASIGGDFGWLNAERHPDRGRAVTVYLDRDYPAWSVFQAYVPGLTQWMRTLCVSHGTEGLV